MFRKLDFVLVTFAWAAIFLTSAAVQAQPQAKPSPSPLSVPTTGSGSTPQPKLAAETLGAQDAVSYAPAGPNTGAKSVLIWIRDNQILAIGLDREYKEQGLTANAYRATARVRGTRLLVEFARPFSRRGVAGLRATQALQFEPETLQAFAGVCGIAAGNYRLNNANTKNPSLELQLFQVSDHRQRPSRHRDECDPFGRHRFLRSIFH